MIPPEPHLTEEDREGINNTLDERIWMIIHSIGENSTRGVTMMIKKRLPKNGRDDVKEEIDEEGRWVITTIKNVIEEDLVICGMYASTNVKERTN